MCGFGRQARIKGDGETGQKWHRAPDYQWTLPWTSCTARTGSSAMVLSLSPVVLFRELGLVKGTTSVHWAFNPDIPGTLVLVPDPLLARTTAATLGLLRGVG